MRWIIPFLSGVFIATLGMAIIVPNFVRPRTRPASVIALNYPPTLWPTEDDGFPKPNWEPPESNEPYRKNLRGIRFIDYNRDGRVDRIDTPSGHFIIVNGDPIGPVAYSKSYPIEDGCVCGHYTFYWEKDSWQRVDHRNTSPEVREMLKRISERSSKHAAVETKPKKTANNKGCIAAERSGASKYTHG